MVFLLARFSVNFKKSGISGIEIEKKKAVSSFAKFATKLTALFKLLINL